MTSIQALAWTSPVALRANTAITKLSQINLFRISFKQVLRKKILSAAVPPRGDVDPAFGGNISYSRIAGMMEIVVIAALICSAAHMVSIRTFTILGNTPNVLANIGGFLLFGSALFAPCAFNHLKPVPLAFAYGSGSSPLSSRASPPDRVFRRDRDLL